MQTKIWDDGYFLNLNPHEKLLFIYFLTNPRVNIIFLYECPRKIISMETGIDQQIIEQVMKKLEAASKMYFFNDFIFLKNAPKYEKFSGEKVEIAKTKLYSALSKGILDWYNKISDTPINTPKIPAITHNLENNTNKSKQDYQKMDENINPDNIPL